MPTAPRPKYQTVADAIEALVRTGKWDGGKMPSVRGIAVQYSVSIVTASRALQVLRDKGLIQSVERAGTFRLPPPTAERWAVVLRLTPGPFRPAATTLVRSGFEAVSRRRPMHLHFDAFDLSQRLTIPQATDAAKQAKESGIGGVFLLPSRSADDAEADTAFVAGCRAAGLPLVLLERDLRDHRGPAENDLVTMDDSAAAAACTRHLFETGRKRVAVVVASPTTSHNDRVAGYLYAVHTAREGKKEPPEIVIRLPEEKPTTGVSAYLADRVAKDRLDGLVCYQDYIAVGVVVELLARGVRVPADVGVVGFDNIDVGTLVPAGLTSYELPAEAIADHAIRLMRERITEPDRPAVRVVVPGRLLIRGSTAIVDV